MKKGGVFFGGIFFVAGLIAFYFIVISPVIDASRMQFWQATKAKLINAEVDSFQSRNDDGGLTTMYKVVMQYQYNVRGNEYIGYRANINNETSNSDHNGAYALVSKVKNEQATYHSINVWYNPNNVSESIYDRSLDFKFLTIMTLFSGVFMTIGVGIIAYSRPEKEQPLINGINADPNKPWATRAQWSSPVIYSNTQKSIKYAWYFALLSGLFFGMFSLSLVGRHPIATLFALLLLIVPVWLVIRARRMQKQWQYYQKVPIKLSTYPGVVGGKVQGGLTIPGQITKSKKCTVTLKCTKYWTRRSGGKTESSQSIVFSKEQQIMAKPSADGAIIDFSFDVPADKPQSSAPSSNYHQWVIVIESELSEVSFNREYEIPVFITEESNTVADELAAEPLTSSELSIMNQRLKVDDFSDKSELELHTPGSKTSLIFAGIGAIFFISGVVIATVGNFFFGLVFASMSCVFIGLGLWGYGRNCKIIVSANNLQIDVYFFSKLVKQFRLNKADVNSIETFSSSKTHTNGKQTDEKFSLRVITSTAKRIDLGGEFSSMKKAVHLKQKIEQLFFAGNRDIPEES